MTTVLKTLDPFSFWPTYRSALQGLGGEASGPDPSYCFHTVYQEFKPGSVTFHMKLVRARASSGELEFRVNAYRPESGMDAILVASLRVALEGVDGDLDVPVRVAVLPGVTYAVFCRHTEPSDLVVDHIEITAEEAEDEDLETYASEHQGSSRFGARGVDEPSLMLSLGDPKLEQPRSQPFTPGQLAMDRLRSSLPQSLIDVSPPEERWRLAFAFQTLRSYGFLEHGACGLLALAEDLPLSTVLAEQGCLVAIEAGPPLQGPFDFVVRDLAMGEVSTGQDLAHRVLVGLKPLLAGGIGIFFFDFDMDGPGSRHRENMEGTPVTDRQELQRTVLRLIGHGCDVAQILLPDRVSKAAGTTTTFGLIVRR